MNDPTFAPELQAEDQARADWYALLARLWYAVPDETLLQNIAGANDAFNSEGVTLLGAAWQQLCVAAMAMDPESIRAEYDSAFIGVGKAEVTPYLAHYFPGSTGKEKILLRVRQKLDALGLVRNEDRREPEDHIAALCDVMRHLILRYPLVTQAAFYKEFLQPGWQGFMEKAENSSQTNFYKRVARFSAAFFALEEQAFAML